MCPEREKEAGSQKYDRMLTIDKSGWKVYTCTLNYCNFYVGLKFFQNKKWKEEPLQMKLVVPNE